MHKLTFFHTIHKPIPLVTTMLEEAIQIFEQNRKVRTIILLNNGVVLVEISNHLVPKIVKNITIRMKLNGRPVIGNHTYMSTTIDYIFFSKASLSQCIHRFIIRKQLDAFASVFLYDFKQRIEKWH